MNIRNKNGDRLSPWIVPLLMFDVDCVCLAHGEFDVSGRVRVQVHYHVYGINCNPRSYMICNSLSWSMVLKAELKSMYSMNRFCSDSFASESTFTSVCSWRILFLYLLNPSCELLNIL